MNFFFLIIMANLYIFRFSNWFYSWVSPLTISHFVLMGIALSIPEKILNIYFGAMFVTLYYFHFVNPLIVELITYLS